MPMISGGLAEPWVYPCFWPKSLEDDESEGFGIDKRVNKVRKLLKLKGAVWKQERKSLEDDENKIHGAEKRSKRKMGARGGSG
jgi:hypothetical protein